MRRTTSIAMGDSAIVFLPEACRRAFSARSASGCAISCLIAVASANYSAKRVEVALLWSFRKALNGSKNRPVRAAVNRPAIECLYNQKCSLMAFNIVKRCRCRS